MQKIKVNSTARERSNPSNAFRMTKRDVAILAAVSHYIMLDRRLVEDLLFTSPDGRRENTNRARERLRLLCRRGYLRRIQRPIYLLHHLEGSRGPAYRLSTKGAQYLAEQGRLALDQLHYSDESKLHPFSVDHALATAEVKIALEQSALRNACSIERWNDEIEMRKAKSWDAVEVQTQQGRLERISIIPDGYFILVTQKGRWHFFLEVDRSTETVSRTWRRKILGYKEYVLSSKFHRRYGLRWPETPLRILTIVPSRERARNLKAATEHYGPSQASRIFLFAVMKEVTSYDPLTAPRWLRAGSESQFALLQGVSQSAPSPLNLHGVR